MLIDVVVGLFSSDEEAVSFCSFKQFAYILWVFVNELILEFFLTVS